MLTSEGRQWPSQSTIHVSETSRPHSLVRLMWRAAAAWWRPEVVLTDNLGRDCWQRAVEVGSSNAYRHIPRRAASCGHLTVPHNRAVTVNRRISSSTTGQACDTTNRA